MTLKEKLASKKTQKPTTENKLTQTASLNRMAKTPQNLATTRSRYTRSLGQSSQEHCSLRGLFFIQRKLNTLISSIKLVTWIGYHHEPKRFSSSTNTIPPPNKLHERLMQLQKIPKTTTEKTWHLAPLRDQRPHRLSQATRDEHVFNRFHKLATYQTKCN